MKKQWLVLCALCALLGLGACGQESASVGCDALPGGIQPALLMAGKPYHWSEVHVEDGTFGTDGHPLTFLPEGYEAAGELTSVTKDPPTQERQLQAGFSASGTVYTCPEKPEVIYCRMTTDWLQDAYIRFVSDGYEQGLLRFQGKLYWFAVGYGDISEAVEVLPAGAVPVGTLQVIDRDQLPSGELEINCETDTFVNSVHGRTLFQDPADPDTVYLPEEQYWAEGHYPAWRACHVWAPLEP